jgi:hypothetical protein
MLMVVPRAFRTARFAHTRACSTKLSCEVAAARDQARDEAARRGTVDVEPYALCHHLHVIFFQARRSAAVTGVGARIQSVDDCFGLLVHFVSPGIKERLSRQRKVLALPPETDRNETLQVQSTTAHRSEPSLKEVLSRVSWINYSQGIP